MFWGLHFIYLWMAEHAHVCNKYIEYGAIYIPLHIYYIHFIWYLCTVFPHIIAAATILFWIHIVRKLFKFSFLLCNKNLNSFLTRWGNYSRRGNHSKEETIWGNTVYISHLTDYCAVKHDSDELSLTNATFSAKKSDTETVPPTRKMIKGKIIFVNWIEIGPSWVSQECFLKAFRSNIFWSWPLSRILLRWWFRKRL